MTGLKKKKVNYTIGVVGLGYVGLPLAVELSKQYSVIGLDLNESKINSFKKGHDPNEEISDEVLARASIDYTNQSAELKKCSFIIVAVPTPIDNDLKPDLLLVKAASKLVGENLSQGTIVVFESTVYPGVTEDICQPIIEQASGLKCGSEWKIGYSPERVNPGDKKHTIDKIVKVVSGMDKETLESVAEVYGSFTNVHKAPNIKTAEAAKVIENIQRDLNIALMNELSLIFEKLEIKTKDVIAAASTKWNFHPYRPGLVGGHCIGVDPYYLTFRAKELDYDPEVILAGRSLNDHMPIIVANRIIDKLKEKGIEKPKVYVMGLTFKEDVKDFRNSKAKDVIEALKKSGATVIGWDPLLDDDTIEKEFGVRNIHPKDLHNTDAYVILAPHNEIRKITIHDIIDKIHNGVIFDLAGVIKQSDILANDITYLTL
ncbi:nucleotide sugar dehydrogenase [Patescibacteria group bacterium]|nr:nucleotide sugar dehydrogenase [Patescibacteria group bacterium]MBU1890122.1 nucleotide sugar dehydrogenase [Patescibacteria group bacterium]